jgi:hypothetical protein
MKAAALLDTSPHSRFERLNNFLVYVDKKERRAGRIYFPDVLFGFDRFFDCCSVAPSSSSFQISAQKLKVEARLAPRYLQFSEQEDWTGGFF